MTYAKGSNISASDFNTFAGTINTTAPYSSSVAATQKVAALLGVGFGDRGYGQQTPFLTKKTVGNPNELLWLCIPDGNNDADGGWNTDMFNIAAGTKYRSSVWFKFKEAFGGTFYHGLNQCNRLNGALDSNPYWHYPQATQLVRDQWYLSVGVVHESGYAGGDSGLSGIYDIHGNKIIASSDFKFIPGDTQTRQRVYHYYDTTTTQRQWMARPRWEAITGSEPTITQLLNAAWDTYPRDTMITPSQWVLGGTSSQGMFIANQGGSLENSIVRANRNGEIQGPTGSVVKAQDWFELRAAISTIAAYQGTSVPSLPPSAQLVGGQSAKAQVTSNTTYDFAAAISAVDANRLATNGGASLSSSPSQLTITRGTSWGAGNTNIVCEATIAFPSEDAARFFFNSGGKIDLVLAHPNTSTPQDSSWNSILAGLGTISFGAHGTIRSGSGGVPNASMGYYEISSAGYSNIFDGTNIGAGAYSNNDIYVEAIAINRVGINGANGSSIRFRVTLFEPHTNAFSDLVQGGTNAKFGFKKAAVTLTGIVTPSFTTTTNF